MSDLLFAEDVVRMQWTVCGGYGTVDSPTVDARSDLCVLEDTRLVQTAMHFK